MKNLKIAHRYAKALFSLMLESKLEEKTYEDMQLINQVFSDSKELQILLKSPIVRENKKQGIIKELFQAYINPLLLKYLLIINKRKRASLIHAIAHEYIVIFKEHQNIETMTVTTAVEMDDAMKEKILALASKLTSKTIEFKHKINPDIIGGFILNLQNVQLDLSVKAKLSKLKKEFSYEGKISNF